MFWFFFWMFIAIIGAVVIVTECLKGIFSDIKEIVKILKK